MTTSTRTPSRTRHKSPESRDARKTGKSGSAGGCAEKARITSRTYAGPRRAAHPTHDEGNRAGIIKTLTEALPPGSFLAASHLTGEHDRPAWAAIEADCHAAGMPMRWRDGDEFAGWHLPAWKWFRPAW
jgi:S-adenosyl methyltransferase